MANYALIATGSAGQASGCQENPTVVGDLTPLPTLRARDLPAAVILQASGAQVATANGSDVQSANLKQATGLLVVLDVTAQSGTTPTLDVAVQAKFGPYYATLAKFSQYAAATGTKGAKIARDQSFATEITLAAVPSAPSGTFAVSSFDWLDTLRAAWAIGGGTPSFTFSVTAYVIR